MCVCVCVCAKTIYPDLTEEKGLGIQFLTYCISDIRPTVTPPSPVFNLVYCRFLRDGSMFKSYDGWHSDVTACVI